MKIKLFIILLLSIITTNNTFATGACLIEDKTADVLLEYIKNNRIVIKNITKEVIKQGNRDIEEKGIIDTELDELKSDFNRLKNESSSIFNELFNFSGYFSYFNYFVTYSISNEIPYQVERDYDMLNNEYYGLIQYLNRVNYRGNSNIVIGEACKGIDNNCSFNGMTSKKIVGDLIANSNNILDLYRLTVMGKHNEHQGEKIILVNNNFKLEVNKNYGTDSVSGCNTIEGGFFETIGNKISDIKIINQYGENGIQDWKDTWGLLIGRKPGKEKILEKELLRNYMDETGVSMENQQIMLNNLEKFNQEGLSINNNFITNTFNSTRSKIKEQVSFWKESIVSDIFPKNKNVIIGDIGKASDNSEISIDLKEKISTLYNTELPYAAVGNISTEKIRAKIIETHMSLDDSIKILEKTIKVSQKVCNSQNKGAGNCK